MLKFTYDALKRQPRYLYFSTNEIHNTITLHDADVMINSTRRPRRRRQCRRLGSKSIDP